MHAVLNSALPIFALILTGFICGYFGVFDRTATDNLNRFAVYLAVSYTHLTLPTIYSV